MPNSTPQSGSALDPTIKIIRSLVVRIVFSIFGTSVAFIGARNCKCSTFSVQHGIHPESTGRHGYRSGGSLLQLWVYNRLPCLALFPSQTDLKMKFTALLPIAICALALSAQDTVVSTSTSYNPSVVASVSSVAASSLSSLHSSLASQVSSFASEKSSIFSAASSAAQTQLNPTQTASSAKSLAVCADGGVFMGVIAGLLAAMV